MRECIRAHFPLLVRWRPATVGLLPIVLLPICQQRCRRNQLWVTWEAGGGDVETAVNTDVTPLACNWHDIKTTPSLSLYHLFLRLTVLSCEWQSLEMCWAQFESRHSMGIWRHVKEGKWHLVPFDDMSLCADTSSTSITFFGKTARQLQFDTYLIWAQRVTWEPENSHRHSIVWRETSKASHAFCS